MATIQLAIRALYEGKEQAKQAQRDLRGIKQAAEEVGTTSVGDQIAQSLNQISRAAEGLGTGTGMSGIRALIDAQRELASSSRLAAAASLETGNEEQANELMGQAAAADAAATSYRRLAMSVDELGIAKNTVTKVDVLEGFRGQNIDTIATRLNNLSTSYRNAARAALELGNPIRALNLQMNEMASTSAAEQQFTKLIQTVGMSADQVQKYSLNLQNATDVEMKFAAAVQAEAGAMGSSSKLIQNKITELQKLAAEQAALAGKQVALGMDPSRAKAMEAHWNRQIKILQGVEVQAKKTGTAMKAMARGDFIKKMGGATSLNQMAEALKRVKTGLVEDGKEAVAAGNSMKAMVTGQSLSNLSAFSAELGKMGERMGLNTAQLATLKSSLLDVSSAHRSTTQSAGMFLQTLNQIGFSIFITISSIRTVIGLFNSLGSAIMGAANAASLMQSFNISMQQGAVMGAAYAEALKQAGQGLLNITVAQQATLRLLKAGVPEFQKTSIMLARLATNAARVSGDLSDVNLIYDKLVRGIVRGSPRLIDDTDVVLKLGKAYDAYAESIGKASDELTEKEQQRAVISALEEEAIRMEELSAALGDLPVDPIVRAKTAMEDFGATTKRVAGVAIGGFINAIINVGNASQELKSVEEIMEEAEEKTIKMTEAAERFAESLQKIKDLREGGVLIPTDELKINEEAWNDLFEELSVGNRIIAITHVVFSVLGRIVAGLVKVLYIAAAGIVGMEDAFVNGVKHIAGYSNNITVLRNNLELMSLWLKGQGDTEYFQNLKQETRDLAESTVSDFEAIKGGFSGLQLHFEAVGKMLGDAIFEVLDPVEIAKLFDEALSAVGAGTGDLVSEMTKVGPAIQSWLDNMQKWLEDLNSAEAKFTKSSAKVWRDYGEAIYAINQEFGERLAELWVDKLDKIEDAHEDFADSIEKINENSADKIEDIHKDARKAEEKERARHNKKTQKDEGSHQRKLNDILRKFELARLKALIDRDARALFEAQMKRDEDLRKAKESNQDKKKDEAENHRDKMAEIRARENERIAEEKAAAEKRRLEAQKKRDEELQDIEDWYWDASDKATKAAERDRQKALHSANLRIRDLREALEEQQKAEAASNIIKEIESARHYAEETGKTAEFDLKIRGILESLSNFTANNPVLISLGFNYGTGGTVGIPGVGGPGGAPLPPGALPPPGGGTGTTPNCIPTLSFVPTGGASCNQSQAGKHVAPDCSRWLCISLPPRNVFLWARDTISGGSPTSPTGGASLPPPAYPTSTIAPGGGVPTNLIPANTGGVAGFSGAAGGYGGPVPVQINTTDQTLDSILQSIVYSAYIDIQTGVNVPSGFHPTAPSGPGS